MTVFAFGWEAFFLNPAVVWVLIPVTAIVFKSVSEIYKQYCQHQERIEMIQNGIHPDLESVEVADVPEQPRTTEYFSNQA